MSASNPLRPLYAPQLFLDRENEINRFSEMVSQVVQGRAGLRRVLVFEGERGVGKTWLLKHLHKLAKEQHGVAAYLIRFDPKYADPENQVQPNLEGSESTDESIVACTLNEFDRRTDQVSDASKRVLHRLLEAIGAYLTAGGVLAKALPAGLALDELSYTLVQMLAVTLNSRRQVFVLLVDSVYEADWSIVSGLEEHILAPLVALNRVVIVLSGRGQLRIVVNRPRQKG